MTMQITSVFILSFVFYCVGTWMLGLYLRDGKWTPKPVVLAGLFVVSRVVVLLISPSRAASLPVVLMEAGLLGGLLLLGYICKATEVIGVLCYFDLLNPIGLLAVMLGAGKLTIATLLGIGVMTLVLWWILVKKPEWKPIRFLPAFSLCVFGVMLIIRAHYIDGTAMKDLLAFTGEPPMALVFGLCFIIAGVITAIVIGVRGIRMTAEQENSEASEPTAVQQDEPTPQRKRKKSSEEALDYRNAEDIWRGTSGASFTKVDLCWLLGITAVFGILVFLGLGARFAPETEHEMLKEDKSNQIVLEFGKEVEISKIEIFLGRESKRLISFSKGIEGGGWDVFLKRHDVHSVFTWNHVEVNDKMSRLGLVSAHNKCYINEIVILDKSGTPILPENASDYPNLFDEQEKYPKDSTYYYRMMFDEVYHGRTGFEFVNTYHAYENTHPPLGKVFIGWGIKLFGMNPFGWRIACALCGILMIPITYLFAWKLFRRTRAAVATTLLMCTMFMNYTLSRIATVDIIVALFVLATFYFMFCFYCDVKEKKSFSWQMLHLLLSGISIGLAMASKWTGVYAAVGICILFFALVIRELIQNHWNKQTILWVVKLFFVCEVCFIIIPAAIYVLSYIDFRRCNFPDDSLIKVVIDNANLMLNYHKDTIFQHSYSSEWYEWMIDKRPLLDALTNVGKDRVSTVATFLNPLVAFGGIVALFHHFYLWFYKKETTAAYLVVCYLTMLAPWWFIVRTVFIYQYFCSALILVFMIVNSLLHCRKNPMRKLRITVIVSIVLFIGFFPVINGFAISRTFVNAVSELFESWGFA